MIFIYVRIRYSSKCNWNLPNEIYDYSKKKITGIWFNTINVHRQLCACLFVHKNTIKIPLTVNTPTTALRFVRLPLFVGQTKFEYNMNNKLFTINLSEILIDLAVDLNNLKIEILFPIRNFFPTWNKTALLLITPLEQFDLSFKLNFEFKSINSINNMNVVCIYVYVDLYWCKKKNKQDILIQCDKCSVFTTSVI